ncbi:ACP phosphodiesterase [Pedobacter caeni]|uniref:Acyl carrier protein phosphodiesterase n=1 Tax=Pedobacter caeni TaxID=288992 RepID=A0A1M4ZI91_9SPHI|nr:hypothetical protein [Pedobacter caeni]SHF17754.1 hypothetical protein SAMN04488522_102338 [Pedobacter caeni]
MVTFKAMNFLSHFYFERDNYDENMVIGVILPDLVKNAQKDSNLYPLKEKHLFEGDALQLSLLKGWERHLEVDRIFHSSEFFKTQTNALKQLILPVFENSPVKPFFLAHIGLELVLDHLLTVKGTVSIPTFYERLTLADKPALDIFLKNCGVADTSVFFKFLDSFISSRYLFSYQKMENISYALNRICMRLWENPFTEAQLSMLTERLEQYKESIAPDYLEIFDRIEGMLPPLF